MMDLGQKLYRLAKLSLRSFKLSYAWSFSPLYTRLRVIRALSCTTVVLDWTIRFPNSQSRNFLNPIFAHQQTQITRSWIITFHSFFSRPRHSFSRLQIILLQIIIYNMCSPSPEFAEWDFHRYWLYLIYNRNHI